MGKSTTKSLVNSETTNACLSQGAGVWKWLGQQELVAACVGVAVLAGTVWWQGWSWGRLVAPRQSLEQGEKEAG